MLLFQQERVQEACSLYPRECDYCGGWERLDPGTLLEVSGFDGCTVKCTKHAGCAASIAEHATYM